MDFPKFVEPKMFSVEKNMTRGNFFLRIETTISQLISHRRGHKLRSEEQPYN